MSDIQKYYDSNAESISHELLKELLNLNDYNIFPHSYLKNIFTTETLSEEYENYHIDFLIRDKAGYPILGIEINGKEHYNDSIVIEHDNIKRDLFYKNAIPLISIPVIELKKYDNETYKTEYKNALRDMLIAHLLNLYYRTNFPAYCLRCGKPYAYRCRNDYKGTFYCCTNKDCINYQENKTFSKSKVPSILSKELESFFED